MVESLHCANCGAPLSLKASQTLAACVYCNSTLRVAAGGTSQPAVTRMAEIPPEVVDEVKRLLLLGNQPKAVEYYAKQTGLSEAEASTAVAALQRTVGYAPPLNAFGIALLLFYSLLGAATVVYGLTRLTTGQGALGALIVFIGVVWVLANWFVLGRGLQAFWLARRGTPAEAVIVKRWTIRTLKAACEPEPVELVRFLLEVCPTGRPSYQTEANGMVRQRSQPLTQPGRRMQVRYDPANPSKVVLIGPAGAPAGT